MTLPNWVGIGSGRCGTTTVHSLLASHPQIYTPGEKELNFFNQNVIDEQMLKNYEALFEKGLSHPSRGEITPGYIISPVAADNILKYIGPSTSIIINLRSPVDRMFSHYQLQVQGLQEFNSFDVAYVSYVHGSEYEKYLRRFYEIFARQCFFSMVYEEDIAGDIAGAMRRLFAFLRVDVFDVAPLKINESTCPTPSFYDSYGAEITPEDAKSGGSRLVKRIVIQNTRPQTGGQVVYDAPDDVTVERMYALARTVTRSLEPALRQQMFEDLFATGLSMLEDLIGRDLSIWRRANQVGNIFPNPDTGSASM